MKKNYFIIILFFVFAIVNAQIINFPDANFKAKLLQSDVTNEIAQNASYQNIKIDANNDGEIQVSEALLVGTLSIASSNINDLTGIREFQNLLFLYCNNNFFTMLDLGNMNVLQINCGNNPNLIWVNVKDNVIISFQCCPPPPVINYLQFQNCPNIQYICANDDEISFLQGQINQNGYSATCNINSYCSFNPGETFYNITGNTKFDINSNGCDALDLSVPNMKISISNGTNSNLFIPNSIGNYSIPVVSGQYSITPVFENPNYFTSTPSSSNVNFPTNTSPFTQNFCIAPNGNHNDLEIVVAPVVAARPGFDAIYKILYKNKGTSTQSGTINLSYNDAVLDFVSATQSTSSQTTNNLNWNFSNLAPFETRTIIVTLNVNAPTETPAVNGGDVLNYSATISGLTDEMPQDNTATLAQIVVNSFDPNDKTCLEGTTVSPSVIGQYVHYMIRFENTGTFNAENVVIKDIIDTSKFDISSLVALDGSHNFETRISNTNKVEFIFQNINLPFDDANNDGYVIFKIKTKPNLVVGTSFSNNASIYFDYNFPIVTNTYTTTISALNNQDISFNNYFEIAPNPIKDNLNLSIKSNTQVSSLSIYNTIGQLIMTITEPQNTIDVSNLKTGNYIIKVVSDKGINTSKFIKE